jgi:tetratricopeptide (TPR) repeat protein
MINRLLAFSALCVAGTVNSALFGGATGLMVGLASNILAADLGTVWERVAQRLQGREAVLENEDLSKAVGRAIAAVIAKVAKEEQFQDYQEPLKRLARRAETNWATVAQTEADLEPLQETNLVRLFVADPAEFGQVKALTPQIWAEMLNNWQLQDPEWTRDAEVMRQVAEELYNLFPKALREVLKEDFATGGRVFGALVLDLFGALCGTLQQQHEVLLARIDDLAGVDRAQVELEFEQAVVRLEALTNGNAQGFQTLAERIESGFGNIEQLLTDLGIQLAGAETRIVERVDVAEEALAERIEQVQATVDAIQAQMEQSQRQVGILKAGSPHKSLAHWQGRTTELAQLYEWLLSDNVQLIGIEGIGGTGKSTLASKVYDGSIPPTAEPGQGEYPKRFWADVGEGATFGELARQVLAAFDCPVPEQESQLVDVLVCRLQASPCLLVIDNLESLLNPERQWQGTFYEEFFNAWCEHGSHSTIVVTTRERPELRGVEWLTLRGLEVAEGVALLTELGIKGDLAEFVELVAGHPLLLRFVADWLRDEYEQDPSLERLAALGLGNLRELLSAPQIQGLHRRQQAGMVLVLDTSFERLSELQKMLLVNGCVYRGAFDAAAVAAVLPETVTVQTVEVELRQLVRRSFLQERLSQNRQFEFQPVVLEYLRYKVGTLTDAHRRAIDYYQSVAKAKPWQTIADIAAYLEIFYHQMQLQQHDQAFAILRSCDDFLMLRGYYTVSLEFYVQLIAVWEQLEKTECWNYGAALTSVGNAYNSLAQYHRASECYQRSLMVFQQNRDRKGEAGSLHNLGNAVYSLGQYQQAIAYYEQSLQIQREIGNRNGEANSYIGLGNAACSLGQYQQAIAYYGQSLQIQREISDRKGEANSLGNLGNVARSLGQYQQAIPYFEQSLQIQREIGSRKGESRSLGNLGYVANALGQYQQAISYFEQSLQIQREIGDRNGEANSCIGLGNAAHSLGQYQQASTYYEKSLQIQREISDRKGEANSLGNLGNAAHSLGQHQLAIAYYEQSLRIQCKIGDRNGEANSLGSLGTAACSLGQHQEAISHYERSLQTQREIGDRNGEANSLFGLGNAAYSLGQHKRAIAYYQQSLQIQREIGDRNGEAASLDNLGIATQAIGQYQQAIEYYKQSLQIQCKISDRRGQAISWLNLGSTLTKVKQLTDALDAYNNARQLYADIGLEAKVQDCDNAIQQLSVFLNSPHRKPQNPFVRLWHWFKALVRSLIGT